MKPGDTVYRIQMFENDGAGYMIEGTVAVMPPSGGRIPPYTVIVLYYQPGMKNEGSPQVAPLDGWHPTRDAAVAAVLPTMEAAVQNLKAEHERLIAEWRDDGRQSPAAR